MDGERTDRVDRTRLLGIYLMLAGVLAIVLAGLGVAGAGAHSDRPGPDSHHEYVTTTTYGSRCRCSTTTVQVTTTTRAEVHVLDVDDDVGAEHEHHVRDDHVVVHDVDIVHDIDIVHDVDDVDHHHHLHDVDDGSAVDDHDRDDDFHERQHDVDHAAVDDHDAGEQSGFDDDHHDGAGVAAEPAAHRLVTVQPDLVRCGAAPHRAGVDGAAAARCTRLIRRRIDRVACAQAATTKRAIALIVSDRTIRCRRGS